ncbi:unknown [Bacteroides sp. CAG:770]|nr:unknown [Bacteroides sp. CAG:770]
MTDSYELVPYLLLFCLQLHFVGERLPFASSANSKMLTERFKSLCRWFDHIQDIAFHIVLFLLRNSDIDNVPGHSEFNEDHSPIHMGQ